MNSPVIIWLLFVIALVIFCLRKPNTARIFLGLFFIVMAVGINIVFVLTAPEMFVQLGKNSFLGIYRWLFGTVIAENPVAFVLPIAFGQIIIGCLMLGRNRYVKFGLLGGIIFLLAITPLGPEELPNPILAAAMAFLMTKEYPQNFIELFIHGWNNFSGNRKELIH